MTFTRLVRFRAREEEGVFFADLDQQPDFAPTPGTTITAFRNLDDLASLTKKSVVVIDRLLAPVPEDGSPIYCVGLNFRSHAQEAGLSITKCPPLWTKPATALNHPNAEIKLNDFCAQSLPDFEGELVFVTSKAVKDISPTEAKDAILGYTVGNDVSCRLYQLQDRSGGQFFFAKAFDGFAPIGSTLVSPKLYENSTKRLMTKVNGKIVQDANLTEDMIFSPEQILSHMSQGTTIPAYTAVMTGTPAGVGAFQKPKSFLRDGDEVEVALEGVTLLKNTIRFE